MADLPLGEDPNRPVRLYADGVFDLFHFGHARLLEQCKKKFKYVHMIVGVSDQEDVIRYKGKSVMTQYERAESVRHCKWVDEVISPCPWTTTLEFVAEHNIDYVCHDDIPYMAGGTGDDVYGHLKTAGKFLATQRTEGISTSDLVMRLIRDYDEYVRRNLARGYTRQDLNLSLIRASQIRLEDTLRTVEEQFVAWKDRLSSAANVPPGGKDSWKSAERKAERGKLEETIDHLRAGLRGTVERWNDKSEALIASLLGQRFASSGQFASPNTTG